MEYVRRLIPSISGLIAFEATARHLSFSRAAEDLALTQGAVSKRVRQLEGVLGFQLLVRDTNQVCLTEVGQAYLAHVKKMLGQLQNSMEDIRVAARGNATLRVAVPAAFAGRWLMPRLASVSNPLPGLVLSLVSFSASDDPRLADVDCAISDERLPWRDAQVTSLQSSPNVAVASPRCRGISTAHGPQLLARTRLLRFSRNPERWSEWFAAAGFSGEIAEGDSFDDLGVMLQAAVHGVGTALLPRLLVADEIREGRLVELFPAVSEVTRRTQYALSVPQRSQGSGAVAMFRQWLSGEVEG